MSNRLFLAILLVAFGLFLAACEVEEEGEEPEATLAAQSPAAVTAQATPTPPAEASPTAQVTSTPPPEASPTPQATSTAAPTNLDWESAQQAAEEDRAKPRFRGELGDFVVVEPNTGSNYPCSEPYQPVANPEQSELYFSLPGDGVVSVEAGACQGTTISINAAISDQTGGTRAGRLYFLGPKMELTFEAPAERLKLMTVAGKPALVVLPIPDCIACVTEVVAIERFPSEGAPGITAWVHTYGDLDGAIALLERIMAAGKE